MTKAAWAKPCQAPTYEIAPTVTGGSAGCLHALTQLQTFTLLPSGPRALDLCHDPLRKHLERIEYRNPDFKLRSNQ